MEILMKKTLFVFALSIATLSNANTKEIQENETLLEHSDTIYYVSNTIKKAEFSDLASLMKKKPQSLSPEVKQWISQTNRNENRAQRALKNYLRYLEDSHHISWTTPFLLGNILCETEKKTVAYDNEGNQCISFTTRIVEYSLIKEKLIKLSLPEKKKLSKILLLSPFIERIVSQEDADHMQKTYQESIESTIAAHKGIKNCR